MMNLAQASTYFDRTPVYDTVTGRMIFRAQVEPFDDSRRDASTAYRRVLSVKAGTVVPAEINVLGAVWLVGAGETDAMENVHRQKYVMAQATAQLKVSTLAQYLMGESSALRWAAPYWSKDAKQTETSSAYPQMFDVLLSSEARAQNVLWSTDQAYLVVSPRPMPSGLLSAHSLKLEHAKEQGSLRKRVYSPAAGGYVGEQATSVPTLQVRWQSLFEYGSQMDERYQEGDASFVLPADCGVDTACTLQASGRLWSVLSVDDAGGAVVAHCRRL